MKKKIALLGAGPHANVIIDMVEREDRYSIVGLIDSKREPGSSFNDYSILGRQEDLNALKEHYDIQGMIVCLGDNWLRSLVASQIMDLCPEMEFVNAIHPSVEVGKGVVFGKGVVVMAGCVINTEAVVGDHCIVNTRSSLEHNCVMEDFSSLSAGVTTGGYMVLKKYAAVALGVTVFDRVCIGEHSVIGSGALVTKDIPDRVVAFGVPAKVVREREVGEKYLK